MDARYPVEVFEIRASVSEINYNCPKDGLARPISHESVRSGKGMTEVSGMSEIWGDMSEIIRGCPISGGSVRKTSKFVRDKGKLSEKRPTKTRESWRKRKYFDNSHQNACIFMSDLGR